MSNTPRDGGPAFPVAIAATADSLISSASFVNGEGMTLRDWFAGQALTSAMSYQDCEPAEVAKLAYAMADAMLKARAE